LWVLRDILFGISLGSAIYLFYWNCYSKKKAGGVLTPITLGALLAATNLLVAIALVIINGLPVIPNIPSLLVNLTLGFLIGFGIGVGILVSPIVASLSTS
jgi:hypothetical protein